MRVGLKKIAQDEIEDRMNDAVTLSKDSMKKSGADTESMD
jgi:hypothetical protein